jgi:hypothetical protein
MRTHCQSMHALSPPRHVRVDSRFSHILTAEGGRTVVMWSVSSRTASTHRWEIKVGKAIIRLRAQSAVMIHSHIISPRFTTPEVTLYVSSNEIGRVQEC